MSMLRVVFSLLALASACPPAQGQEGATPSELVRSLRAAQDKVALGDVDAHIALRALLVDVGRQLLATKPEVWKEPGNARAAVAFVLSGGDGRLLRRVVALGPLPGVSDKLLQGVLARGEGRPGDAAELLLPINARSLDPSIAGHVALVQAELVAKKDPKKAVAFLDDARLLAPGTLIEEAALRRQVGIVAAIGEFDRFEMLAANYMRRFPRSIYAAAFRRQFAADMAGRDDAAEPSRLERMAAVLEAMGPAERRDAYLSIAREALARGKVELARFAAVGAARLAEGEEADRRRAKLYEAAALVATADFEAAMATLQALDEARLAEEDLALLEAARAVGAEVARPTPSAEATGTKPAEDMAAAFNVAGMARGAIARADELIARARK
jgi:chemotaxis protein MotC